jgi:hypothetical protein
LLERKSIRDKGSQAIQAMWIGSIGKDKDKGEDIKNDFIGHALISRTNHEIDYVYKNHCA